MIYKSDLQHIIQTQRDHLFRQATYPRRVLHSLRMDNVSYATIISGIRRCGKSTLVEQLIQASPDRTLLLNFDAPQLYNFQIDDFQLLDTLIEEQGCQKLFFDEIQNIKGWELYVNAKLREGFQVVVTGSNATLLSKELGTHLTGRHIDTVLHPFSFAEFCEFQHLAPSVDSLNAYLGAGGFPAYLKTQNEEVLSSLLTDILYRDILVRYNLRDEKALRSLLLYLMGNIGNRVSATRLASIIGVKTTNTAADYLTYLENTYLFSLLPRFAYAYRVQVVSPKKVYCCDLGLQSVTTPSYTQDKGHKLENMAFLELQRQGYELFYFDENKKECDFVACSQHRPLKVVQVCQELNHENEEREVGGLVEAMRFFHLDKGLILTEKQEDTLRIEGKEIQIMPLYQAFL